MDVESNKDVIEKDSGVEQERSLSSQDSFDHVDTTGIANKLHIKARYGDSQHFDGRFGWFWRMSYFIDSLGEARGVDRQPESARGKGGFWQFWSMCVIWVGATGSLPTMSGFFIGPLLFDLGFKDSMSAGILGVTIGCFVSTFGAISGPKSGLRTMIASRFWLGWWPAKFVSLLNALTLLGWSVVSSVFGGQLLHALNSSLPLEIGILIVAILCVVIAVFGIRLLIVFDRIIVIPTMIVFMLVYICTASEYPTQSKSVGTSDAAIRANWLSFFSSCISLVSPWVAMTSDFSVDLPRETSSWKLFIFMFITLTLPSIFVGCIGIGIGSAARFTNTEWNAIYQDQGEGGLLAASVNKWHGGGTFLVVLMFISLITNNVLGTYSIPLSVQVFGRGWVKVPRYLLTILGGSISFVLASAGRNKLYVILSNFIPMTGYWSLIFATILILEYFVFRRRQVDEPDWQKYNDKSHFPVMWASIAAFCAGIVGCVLGMDQTYYAGVLAKKIGTEGADIGVYLSVGFCLVTYIPLRAIELSLRKQKPIQP